MFVTTALILEETLDDESRISSNYGESIVVYLKYHDVGYVDNTKHQQAILRIHIIQCTSLLCLSRSDRFRHNVDIYRLGDVQ